MSFGSVMDPDSIQARIVCNTEPHKSLPYPVQVAHAVPMGPRTFKFREVLTEAVRHNPTLWHDGKLNLTAIAEYVSQRGATITQANLHRLCEGNQKPGEKYVAAMHKVFGIPKYIVRGEPVSAEMEELLTQYRLSTLLLARKIESLPREAYETLARQVDIMYDNQKQLRLTDPKVTSIDRRRSPSTG